MTLAAVKRKDRGLGVLATYTLGSFLLLSAAVTRLPHYLLMVYPAMAMCVGMALSVAWRVLPERGRAALVIVPITCAVLFLQTAAAPPFDHMAVASHEAEKLGRIVLAQPEHGDVVYSYNWYAPAFGYYAERKWSMLTNVPRVANTVGNTGSFRHTRSMFCATVAHHPWFLPGWAKGDRLAPYRAPRRGAWSGRKHGAHLGKPLVSRLDSVCVQ